MSPIEHTALALACLIAIWIFGRWQGFKNGYISGYASGYIECTVTVAQVLALNKQEIESKTKLIDELQIEIDTLKGNVNEN